MSGYPLSRTSLDYSSTTPKTNQRPQRASLDVPPTTSYGNTFFFSSKSSNQENNGDSTFYAPKKIQSEYDDMKDDDMDMDDDAMEVDMPDEYDFQPPEYAHASHFVTPGNQFYIPPQSDFAIQNYEGDLLNSLPDELVTAILSWCSFLDLLQLRLVCRRWNYIILQNIEAIVVKVSAQPGWELVGPRIITNFERLTTLQLKATSMNALPSSVLEACNMLPRLNHVWIVNHRMSPISLDTLLASQTISELRMDASNLYSTSSQTYISPQGFQNHSIESITLVSPDTPILKYIGARLANIKEGHFWLSNGQIATTVVSSFSQLHSLELDLAYRLDSFKLEMYKQLEQCANLSQLTLRNGFTSSPEHVQSLLRMPALHTLHMNVGYAAIDTLADLARLPHLRYLTLTFPGSPYRRFPTQFLTSFTTPNILGFEVSEEDCSQLNPIVDQIAHHFNPNCILRFFVHNVG